jgi:hypothetical protein
MGILIAFAAGWAFGYFDLDDKAIAWARSWLKGGDQS